MRLSLCSKKAQLIVKHTFIKWKQRRSLELILHGAEPSTVNYSYFPLLSIHDWPAIVNSTHIETVQIGVFTVPMDTSSKATYWVHKLEAIRSVLNYVMEIFNSEIQCFDIEDDVTSSELNWIFNWMTGRTTIFKAIYVNITQATTEDLNLFFQNVKVSDCLELRGSRNSDNCYPPYPFFQSVRHFINIINGFWLEKRHLDSLNCTVIYMSKTRFSSEDMNIYLKKWKEGQAFSRLKCSLIDITDANTEKLLEGMDVTEVQTVRKYKTLRETYIKLHGGFDITRHDGVVATVNIRRRRGANEFTWVVWPDLIHGESILDEQIDYL
ncbi:hypothetical protein GCK72_011120 [Caenorhabditis remanei]|uniref:Sdz-33 F-box domain-containing protein n=1 Tax=Caenorhabditis remanei TaxID=31234 RepID=A0A6A5H6N9_CAERE|nr:hypothetical protein GCK72_011120 [Caenorhabditis remanei]KAF1762857.1 hypothetical protein GCK72_011120 [Caenorhabditis remanei]